MRLMDKRVLACLSFMMIVPLGWADKVISDLGSMYDPSLGERIGVYQYDSDGTYYWSTAGNVGSGLVGGGYSTPQEAFNNVVKAGICGQADYKRMTCYTGVGSAENSKGEVGDGGTSPTVPTTSQTQPATSNTQNSGSQTTQPTSSAQTSKSCGSMVNGVWVEKNCNEPSPAPQTSPTPEPNIPQVPTPREPSAEEKKLIAAFKALRDRYIAAFEALRQQAIGVKTALSAALESCVIIHGSGTDGHKRCAENARKYAQDQLEKIQERISKTEAEMNKDFAELEKQIPKSGNVGSINANFDGSVQNSGGVNVTINNGSSSNNATGSNTTVNNSSTNTTVNNTTVNNGGNTSTTVVNNGSKGGVSTSQPNNSADTGLLSDIKNILNGISDKIGKIGSGGDKAQSGETGSGDKGNPNGKENGEDNGETLSEFCEKNPQHLSCTKLGTEGEIEEAIAAGKGNDGRGFDIGEHEIGIPQLSRTSDFTETGSCPPPKTFKVLNSQQEISYQPLCDTALKIRPFVIFCAIFIAFGLARASITNS